MSSGPFVLLPWLETFHGVAVVSWMAGQLCLWRLHAQRTTGPQGSTLAPVPSVDRRALRGLTTLAAIVSLFTGAGLIAL
jgi:uncharacterized membrane protein